MRPHRRPPLPEVNLLAVKIRLARHGAKKAPYYRVVIADGRARRDGRFLEIVGRYNPRTTPSFVELDLEKVDAWVAKGAQPTEAAAKIIAIARGDKEVPAEETKLSKKAASKIAEEAAAAEKAKADAAAEKEAAKEAAAAEKAAAAEAAAEAAAAPEEPAEAAEEAVAEPAPEEVAVEAEATEEAAEEGADAEAAE
jgi:small subunit ribosomal protein S16